MQPEYTPFATGPHRPGRRCGSIRGRSVRGGLGFALLVALGSPAWGVVLWSDPGATLIADNGAGRDLIEGAVKRDDTANDTLYFRFHVDPQSDSTTEEYFAAFQLFEGETERLGVGNALKAWAYSAFQAQARLTESGPAPEYVDLHSSVVDQSSTASTVSYELPRRGVERTIVFKVQYVAGGDDLVTVWLNPDLSPGANEIYQAEPLTTRFNADASFDEIRLRHGGGGPGWIFSGLAIATSFADFVDTSSAKPASPAPDQNFNTQRLGFASWQRESGMPRGDIRAIAQTRDGYLWLGAEEGLARFDGVRFVPFDLTPHTRGHAVCAMLGDAQGALWIGTAGAGLLQLIRNDFRTFTAQDGLPTNHVTCLAEDKLGQLWIGTRLGLRVHRSGTNVNVPALAPLLHARISALHPGPGAAMWIGASELGVFKFDADRLTPITDPVMDPLLRQSHCLLVDASERLWVGAGEESVLCLDAGQWRRFRLPRHAATPFVSALAAQPDGTVWAGSTGDGLFQFKEGRLAAVSATAGLPDSRVRALFVDREDHLWIGRDSGLSKLRRDQLFALGQGEGLGFGPVNGLAEVTPGIIWAVRSGDGLYRREGRTFTRLTAAGLPPRDPQLGAMLVTRDGQCWVACTNGLLLFRDPQAVADESRLLPLPHVGITALAEGFDHSILAGSRQGELWQLAAGRWRRLTRFSATNAITALQPESGGSIWVGTDGDGLHLWNATNHLHFNRDTGLASDSIRTLHRDANGTLWIGTADGGLARWRSGQLASFTTQQGLPENTISQILEDDFARLWLGGSSGIACVNMSDFEGPSPPRLNSIFPYRYGSAEGLGAEACSSGIFPAALKSTSGLLWFPTLKGLLVANPRLLPTNAAPPVARLEELLVDGRSLDFSPGAAVPLRLGAGRHQLELRYTVISFESPERISFRYQLAGLDPDWVEAGSRRVAFYNYVPPGEYRFRLAASQGGSLWHESSATLHFFVARHFWQSPWVTALGATGLLAGVAGLVRFLEKRKAQRRLKRLEQERALERERHRIAQDLHDEMGAKLCRISFLSEHAQRAHRAEGEMRDQIHAIADTSRELLHTLDEIVWAVNPHNDTLEHVASYLNQYAQNYFHNTGIACEFDMPDQFDPHPVSSQARHHLFLAVHEAFTNILKHSGATRARVTMACTHARYEIRVEDNGRGFDVTQQLAGPGGPGGSTDGLRNMRERLESVGGSCRAESSPHRGTTLWFTLPLRRGPARKAAK